MSEKPLSVEEVQAFLEALDEAGEGLRELVDVEDPGDTPAIQYYMDGSAFVEAGYLMVEQLSERYPGIFRALRQEAYDGAFAKARRGQVSWGEALAELPEFLRDYARGRVAEELFGAEEG